MRLRRVVLPAPKNPVKTVTGILWSFASDIDPKSLNINCKISNGLQLSQPGVDCISFCSVQERGAAMKLKGKVAFITGFGSGLGQAIAVLFAKEGCTVAGTSKTESKGIKTVATIEKSGGQAVFRAGDVASSTQMMSLVEETV